MAEKHEKPYAEYPLWWHRQGYWAKKIKGKLHYFGPRWGTWQEALSDYKSQVDAIQLGEAPGVRGVTVADLCDEFLSVKAALVDSGEFAPRSFRDYQTVCQKLVDHLGENRDIEKLTPSDFGKLRSEIGRGVAVTTLSNFVRIARMVFRFAETEELITGRVSFGSQFSEPSKKSKKQHRAKTRQDNGLRMFEPEEVRRLLYAANPTWRAMILLGINCGLGNSDISRLTLHQPAPVFEYPRPKTGERRVCVLWPETLEAIKAAKDFRPAPQRPFSDRLFLTKSGNEWVQERDTYSNDEIAKGFSKLLSHVGLKRPGLNFYALRHTVVTIGEELADKPALSLMLGHSDSSMAAEYRERISLSRLEAIVDHNMRWLATADNVRPMSAF